MRRVQRGAHGLDMRSGLRIDFSSSKAPCSLSKAEILSFEASNFDHSIRSVDWGYIIKGGLRIEFSSFQAVFEAVGRVEPGAD